jgi:hypothetical protein
MLAFSGIVRPRGRPIRPRRTRCFGRIVGRLVPEASVAIATGRCTPHADDTIGYSSAKRHARGAF